jgi:hypothetical protein
VRHPSLCPVRSPTFLHGLMTEDLGYRLLATKCDSELGREVGSNCSKPQLLRLIWARSWTWLPLAEPRAYNSTMPNTPLRNISSNNAVDAASADQRDRCLDVEIATWESMSLSHPISLKRLANAKILQETPSK